MTDFKMNAHKPLNQGLIIGIPLCGRPCMPEWALGLATLRMPTGLVVQYATSRGLEVGEARNQIVDQALKVGAKYVLFIDDDTVPPPYAMMNLLYALEQQSPPRGKAMVCAGIYCAKADPPTPIVYKDRGSGTYWDWKFGDVFECASIGTGCMLVNTDIFKILEKPWFKTMHEPVKADFSLLEFGKEVKYDQIDLQLTDDIYFCYKVQDAGYTVLAHGGVLCAHWDVNNQIEYRLAADSYPMLPREEKPKEPEPWNAFKPVEPTVTEGPASEAI